MKVCIEECDGRTVIKGVGIYIEINSDDQVIVDTTQPIVLRGSSLKKLSDLPSSAVNAVLKNLGH